MRVGAIRTSIKLEKEFWSYLKDVAEERSIRLSALVNEVAEATPERTNLASTLRTFALQQALERVQTLQREVDLLALAGSTEDLLRVLALKEVGDTLEDAADAFKTVANAVGSIAVKES